MGCTSSQKPNLQHNVLQTGSKLEKEIEKKLAPMLQLSNAHNINKRYEYLIEIIPDKFVGEDMFKTNAYKSKVPEDQLK